MTSKNSKNSEKKNKTIRFIINKFDEQKNSNFDDLSPKYISIKMMIL